MNHTHTPAIMSERCYRGPVSRDEDPSAHGCIEILDECHCGAQRRRNVNGWHEEAGPWETIAELAERRSEQRTQETLARLNIAAIVTEQQPDGHFLAIGSRVGEEVVMGRGRTALDACRDAENRLPSLVAALC